jgi:serpin B
MAVEGSFAYLANEQIEAVSLPYAGGGYVLDLIMPRRASSTALTRLLEKPGSWIGLRQTSHRYGHVEIPRLDIESRFELKDTLSSAGMVAAFDPGRADFTAMTSDRARLFVGRVIQKVKLTLDEKGTIAAAATAAEMIGGLDPRPEFSFMANRPFLLMLRRISDNRLLIIGVFDATVH